MSEKISQIEEMERWRLSVAEEQGFFPLQEPLLSFDGKKHPTFYSYTLEVAQRMIKDLQVAGIAELVNKKEIHPTVLVRLLEELQNKKLAEFDQGLSEKIKEALEIVGE